MKLICENIIIEQTRVQVKAIYVIFIMFNINNLQ